MWPLQESGIGLTVPDRRSIKTAAAGSWLVLALVIGEPRQQKHPAGEVQLPMEY
jgi:hypothetical protein